MRRPQGTGLVDNEYRALAAAIQLAGNTNESWTVSSIIRAMGDVDPTRPLINEATAYRITRRLVDRGWFDHQWALPVDQGRPTRKYWFTDEGREAAASELADYAKRRNADWAQRSAELALAG